MSTAVKEPVQFTSPALLPKETVHKNGLHKKPSKINSNGHGSHRKTAYQPTEEIEELPSVSPGALAGTLSSEPQSKDGIWVSEEEYWEVYYHDLDFNYEWNNGILEEKPLAKVKSSDQYLWFTLALNAYLKTHPVARIVALEIGFRMTLKEKVAIRKPDLFVVRNDNSLPIQDEDASYRGICNFCVESLSDSKLSEILRDTEIKREEYREAGIEEYYILDADGKHTAFYRLTANGDYEEIPFDADRVIRSSVLPGFQFREGDLYRQPSLIEMAQDEVYRAFVLPEYSAERQRADDAESRAEQERLRAEQEHLRAEAANARAERLAAQLRALGLVVE